jgi:predicted GNAT family acetyltransferase
MQNNELVGLAGFNLDGSALTTIRARDIIKEFGPWSGMRRIAWASILHRTPRSDELLVDGIVVRADRRGHGIGTKLMYRLFDVALAHGKRVVRLDVVDTNPAARHLYEGLGFVAIKTEKVPFLRRFMGFAAATTMERSVS